MDQHSSGVTIAAQTTRRATTARGVAPTVDELVLHGASLALRYPSLRDAAALFALASDPEVTRFLSWGPYRHEREAEAWLKTLPERRASGIALELAVVDMDDNPIGITLLSELHVRDRRACGSVGAGSSMTIALTPTLPAVC